MKFPIKDFFSKLRKLRIWSHLLKKFLMENFIFCAVAITYYVYLFQIHFVHYNPRFANLAAAVPEAGGLMVMGFFLKVTQFYINAYLDSYFTLTK